MGDPEPNIVPAGGAPAQPERQSIVSSYRPPSALKGGRRSIIFDSESSQGAKTHKGGKKIASRRSVVPAQNFGADPSAADASGHGGNNSGYGGNSSGYGGNNSGYGGNNSEYGGNNSGYGGNGGGDSRQRRGARVGRRTSSLASASESGASPPVVALPGTVPIDFEAGAHGEIHDSGALSHRSAHSAKSAVSARSMRSVRSRGSGRSGRSGRHGGQNKRVAGLALLNANMDNQSNARRQPQHQHHQQHRHHHLESDSESGRGPVGVLERGGSDLNLLRAANLGAASRSEISLLSKSALGGVGGVGGGGGAVRRYVGVREMSFSTSEAELAQLPEPTRSRVQRAQMRWRALRVLFLTIVAFRDMLRRKELYGAAGAGLTKARDAENPERRRIIDPLGRRMGMWNMVVCIATLYNVIAVPVSACMHIGAQQEWPIVLFNGITDAIMLVDIYVHFRTGYYVEGKLVTDQRLIRRRYLRTWFFPHAVAQLPAGWIALWAGASPSVVGTLRSPRLLNLVRFPDYFDTWEAKIDFNPIVMRFVKLALWIVLLAHVVGCIWYAIGRREFDHNFPPSGWLVMDRGEGETLWFLYLRSLYWAVMTMTTVGYGDIRPVTDGEYLYATAIMIIGQSIYAFLISNMSSLIAAADTLSGDFSKKIDIIAAYIRYRRIPSPLAHRIRTFYDWVWSERRGVQEVDVLTELPEALRSEITLFLVQTAVANTPLFRKVDKIFLNRLTALFKPVVAAPGDLIILQGEVSLGMYIVLRGKLDVIEAISDDLFDDLGDAPSARSIATTGLSEEIVGTLIHGDVIGELSLVHPSRRSCSVRASEFSDLYFLHRGDFAVLLEEFPDTPLGVEESLREALQLRTGMDPDDEDFFD